jgi:DNA mismatch repair protein MutL
VSKEIIILPKEIREKIRAGEVVERPASVVKELIENSIDALSTQVICEVERGGIEKIRVIDNGIGMNREELELSLERYATSKIRHFGDLHTIETFGFRGEALPSIRAISELTIESRERENGTGFLIRSRGDEAVEKRPQPMKVGTIVEIRRLFFNTPARRKFLKSPATEFRHIRRVLIAMALVNRSIHFILYHNGKVDLDITPTDDLKRRFAQIVNPEVRDNLLSLESSSERIKIGGIISRPEKSLSRRDFQYVFVNRRWITSPLIRQAIYKAYGNSLWGKHPVFIIELIVPGSDVDINVHPGKKEVKFRKEREVFETVYSSIQRALSSKEGLPKLEKSHIFSLMKERESHGRIHEGSLFMFDGKVREEYKEEKSIPKGIWQLHATYIFASTKTGFMIVDQHAAHERILYDKMIRRKEPIPPQMLLFQLKVDLDLKEEEFLEENIDIFFELGFRIKKFSGRTIVIEGIPPFMKEIDEGVIHNLLGELIDNVKDRGIIEEIAREIACHVAIKAGEELKQEEMNVLIDNLFATDEPYTCPHGRPTMIKFTLSEMERKFRRK